MYIVLRSKEYIMKKIFLYGELGKSLGKEWELEVDSVQEALWAIEANTGKLTSFLSANTEKFGYYTFRVDDKKLSSREELESKFPKSSKEIHIMPQVAGGDIVNILIQVVIAVATALIMQAIFKPPKPKDERQTRSYLFSGPENTAAQGIPVPLGYGRLRVGSVVISASLRNRQSWEFQSNLGGVSSSTANPLDKTGTLVSVFGN